MCIAILSPKGTEITAQQFRNCWDNNFDGAGFMYNDDENKLRVVKEMSNCSKLYKKYARLKKKHPDATFVLHFRISNRGEISRDNCHPFKVNNQLGFVHNGTITDVEKDTVKSDTNVFNRDIMRNMPSLDVDMLNSPAMQALVGKFIGYSKLVFLDNNGKFSIINESKGSWEDGIWYSNDSHKRVKTTVDMGGKTVSKAELKKIQGGLQKVKGDMPWDGEECGIGYRHYDDSNHHYIGGRIDDLHDSSSLNSSVGKKYPAVDGSFNSGHYIVSDGGLSCQACGIATLTGELMSVDKECLECVTEEESVSICQAAVNDGAIIADYQGTLVVDNDSISDIIDSLDGDTLVECSFCTTVLEKRNSIFLKDWECTLCRTCTNNFVDDGTLDERYRFEDEDEQLVANEEEE